MGPGHWQSVVWAPTRDDSSGIERCHDCDSSAFVRASLLVNDYRAERGSAHHLWALRSVVDACLLLIRSA